MTNAMLLRFNFFLFNTNANFRRPETNSAQS